MEALASISAHSSSSLCVSKSNSRTGLGFVSKPVQRRVVSAALFDRNPTNKSIDASKTSYAAPIEDATGSYYRTRPLAEILRDLNKRVPDYVLQDKPGSTDQQFIPWFQANRMLSFYAPGWCGEVRDIKFSDDGQFVTVIYRVTIRGSDGEAFREATGTVRTLDVQAEDPTQKAEAMAFVRACARFGLGLYLHHAEDKTNQ